MLKAVVDGLSKVAFGEKGVDCRASKVTQVFLTILALAATKSS